MKVIHVALVLTAVLVALAVIPTVWVLGLEAFRRASTRRALREVEAAIGVLGNPREGDLTELAKTLNERFSALTIERAVLQLLRSEDAASHAWGARLFVELGLVERYSKRLREAPKWSERTNAAEVLGLASPVSAVPALVAALRDRYEDDASVVVAAAAALAKLRDPSAIPLLVKELISVDERSSRNVAEALVGFGQLAVTPLLELLVDAAHPPARVWAARILGRIGDARATDDLVTRLHDRDDLLRMAAAEALGMIGDRRALQPLVRATLRDPAPQVRAHAAGAVGKIEGERAIDVLVAALADADYATRLRALEAFETMRITDTSPLEAALRDPNAEVRRRAALALERVGYLERIVGELTAEDRETRERAYAAFLELGRVGLVDGIASYVHHTAFEVRALSARACGELGIPRVAPLLVDALSDELWPVRASACEALGKLRYEKAPAALVARLTDGDETVREAAVEALTNYAAKDLKEHVGAIAAAYQAASVPMRTNAVTLLARLDGPVADDVLSRASTDPSDGVRLRAVAALGGRGDAMVEHIVARLTDPSLEVRMAAVAALGPSTSSEAFEGLLRALSDALPDVRERIAEALSRGARELLFSRLEDLENNPSLDVRLGVAWTLGKTGDPTAVPTLARFLRDKSEKLRASAAGALAKISSPAALDALLSVAGDPDGRVRAAVVNALGRGGEGNPRVIDALEKRAHDPDSFVRNRAVVALARAGGSSVEARVSALGREVAPAAYLVALGLVGTESALMRVLDAIGDEGSLDRIIAFLDHEDAAVRTAFFEALHLDPPAADAPRDAAALAAQYETVMRTSLDVNWRKLAVMGLGRLKGDRAVEVLADALLGDPSEGVRLQAAEVLQRRADTAVARKALARAVADPNGEVAIQAAKALAGRREKDVADALARRLGAGSPDVQSVVEGALADLHRDDPMAFVDWMMGVDVPELLTPAVRVLAGMANPVTFPLLRSLVQSHAAAVRAASVRALGALPMSEAAAAVDELVQDPSEEVRLAVLDVMMLSPDPLLRTAALRRDPSVTVRAHAAAALDRTNPTLAKQAVKILEGMLDDAAPEVRAAALASLAGSADSEGLRAFGRAWPKTTLETRLKLRVEPRGRVISGRLTIRLTTSADPSERRAAVAALGALKVTGFHVHIVPALRDPSPDVRIAAVQALASVNDESVRARLSEMVSDPDGAVRDAARRSTLRTVG